MIRTDRTDCTTRPSIARRILRSRMSAAITAAAVTASVAGGVAYAATSPIDAEGTIHACYNATSGAMKLLTATSTCPKSASTPISWNQQGAIGPQGAPGAPGAAGVAGPVGPQGDKGDAGGLSESETFTAGASLRLVNACIIGCSGPTYRPVAVIPYVPAGRYLVNADLSIDVGSTNSGSTSALSCFVGGNRPNPFPYDWFFDRFFSTPFEHAAGSHVAAAVNSVISVATAGPVGIYCTAPSFTVNDINATGSLSAITVH